ncbi:hypothetical protein DICSQDRAFT_171863 [Dichomitus squalens LYAD-421 SS1]|uniref:F-box domain-containing protein n=1 Tax=Dichomitus squalens (strain LYAD-421) TaxID=732165 RepID=R7SXJ6_DICSQ|nr:uncharacterized protein DICSQDRAFT_171863 [Dichomitus squalens LYAD-421 SS1]EJF59687.1 hypothetical protein DICSQDRAFT_171863 [Dichomitus squalens LYAD-421 SS1]
MPTLLSLPPELLIHILDLLSSDVWTLRNCAYTCSALRPFCRHHLLAVADFNVLGDADAEPFRDCITHLQMSVKSGGLDGIPETHIEVALRLPKLKKMSFCGPSNPFRHWFPTGIQEALHLFSSVTELALVRTTHASVEQLQSLISSLNNLSHLTIHGLTVQGSVHGNYFARHQHRHAEELGGPRLTHLNAAPSFHADGTAAVLQWLSHTPTRHCLRTLDIPAASRNTQFVVDSFGPTIHRLCVAELKSIAAWKTSFIHRYTNLLTLEVGSLSQLSWQPLYKVVAGICSPDFCELVLRYDAVADADARIAASRVETSPVDYILHDDMPALQKVCFVVQYDSRLAGRDAQWKDAVRERVRSFFYRLAEDGTLQVEFEAQRIRA